MSKIKAALGALLLTASTGAPALAEPVTLQFWTTEHEGQQSYVLAQEYDKKHDDITVNIKHVDLGNMLNDLTRAYATGNAPDVVAVDNPDNAMVSSRGVLLDLDPLIAKSSVIKPDDLFPGPRNSGTWKGKIYGISRGSNTLALYYNADMFKAKGLDPDKPPRTWEELYQDAKALNDPARNVYGLAFSAVGTEEGTFQFLPFVQTAGADYDSIASDGAVRALQFWQKLLDEKLASPDTLIRSQWDSTGTFNAGNAAMVISGPWELPRMQSDAKFDFRVALLPVEKDGSPRASALGEFNNVIMKTTKHPQEAFGLLEYVYSQANRNWNEFGMMSAVKTAVVADPKWPAAYAVFTEQLKYARARGPNPNWPKISKAIQTAIQSTLTHQTDAKTALEQAQKTIKPLLTQ